MQIDKELLQRLATHQSQHNFQMKIGNHVCDVDATDVIYSENPMNKPSMRGGVYFSERMGFKLKATVSDLSLAKVLSKTMLGPNTDFAKIQFLTTVEQNGTRKSLTLHANLTNYVQRSSGLELNLMVVGTELSD